MKSLVWPNGGQEFQKCPYLRHQAVADSLRYTTYPRLLDAKLLFKFVHCQPVPSKCNSSVRIEILQVMTQKIKQGVK